MADILTASGRVIVLRLKTRSFGREKSSHQIFLEPEGLDDDTVYPNGISTSLPAEIQEQFLHRIAGLERAVILQPGYAVEYDFVDPKALRPTLELPALRGLSLPVRSMEQPGTRKRQPRGLLPESTRRAVHSVGMK